jgi:uncharacterized membrane protein
VKHRTGGFVRTAPLIGVILIVLGVVALAYQGITYTTHKKVLAIGPVQATTKEHKTIPLPPILGGVVLIAGVVLVLAGGRTA